MSGALAGGPTTKLTKKEPPRKYGEKFDILTTHVSQVVWAVRRIVEGGGCQIILRIYRFIYSGYIKKARFYIENQVRLLYTLLWRAELIICKVK